MAIGVKTHTKKHQDKYLIARTTPKLSRKIAIQFTDADFKWINKQANLHEISFAAMVRKLIFEFNVLEKL